MDGGAKCGGSGSEPVMLEIKELYVADGCRRKGVGKLLMKAVAKEAEEAGCGMIKWYVAKWNERGVQF